MMLEPCLLEGALEGKRIHFGAKTGVEGLQARPMERPLLHQPLEEIARRSPHHCAGAGRARRRPDASGLPGPWAMRLMSASLMEVAAKSTCPAALKHITS